MNQRFLSVLICTLLHVSEADNLTYVNNGNYDTNASIVNLNDSNIKHSSFIGSDATFIGATTTSRPIKKKDQEIGKSVGSSWFQNCKIRPKNDMVFLKESVMYIYEIEIYNASNNPLKSDVSRNYRPWKWYRTTSGHGKTLLTLSFNYDVLSLSILTIGVQRINVQLEDFPEGCFGKLTAEERVDLLRQEVFNNFKSSKTSKNQANTTAPNSPGQDSQVNIKVYVCNEMIHVTGNSAEFGNKCCVKESDNRVTCYENEDNTWITVLYVCIGLVKLFLMMFCPLLLPTNMYNAAYVASEYLVRLTNTVKLKMFVSASKTTSVRYKNRLTLKDIQDWPRFQESIDKLPKDTICNVKVPELRIKVKGKRIITANEPPTGLLKTFYDNLIRCKIRQLDPFKECCETSIYASLQPLIKYKCTWETLTLTVVKILLLLLVPLPFYFRMFVYYKYEETEFTARRTLANKLGLHIAFHPIRMNIVQYLSPISGLFAVTYSVYIIAGFSVGFIKESARDKLKSIVRSAFQDMRTLSRTSVLQIVLSFILWPFRKLGLLALITCPIITTVSSPLWSFIFILYCIPTVYLSYRLIYHSHRQLGSGDSMLDSSELQSKIRKGAYKVKKKLVKIDKGVHVARNSKSKDDKEQSPFGYGQLNAYRRFFLQLMVSVFCLSVLFASVLLFVEAAGVIVEILIFTMMGIIVNAGSTLRYVSMALLVVVYMHSCYDNVYENYLMFNETIISDIMDRVDDLKKIASLPSSMQDNAAFQVKPVEAVDEIQTSLNLEKGDPQWKIGHLLLFFDSFDTPRIPLNLFKKLCEVRVHGAPGPVYINLLKATGKFSIIVVFLFFVMIVVMAFGSANQMSSTNQTLATLAGGFVPMLLKNVLSSKGVRLNLKTLSFKGQIDEIIAEYKQNWPIFDLTVEEYDPVAEAKKEKAEAEAKEAEEKDKEKSSDERVTEKNMKNMIICTDGVVKDDDDEKRDLNEKPAINSVVVSVTGRTLNVPDPFMDSLEDLTSKPSEGIPRWLSRLSIAQTDDNFVDLFVDLSDEDAEQQCGWLYGSSDSIGHSMTMLNELSKPKDNVDPRLPYQPERMEITERYPLHPNNNVYPV